MSELEKRKRGQRGPGRKNLIAQQPQPPAIQPQPESDADSNYDQSVNIEIESHAAAQPAPEESGFGATLRRAAERSGLFDDDPAPVTSKKKSKANQDEFNSLVIAVLTLSLSFAKIPQDLKPADSELSIFSNHLSGILLRHLPINKGLSADALDIIGLFAVASSYYARVSPQIEARKLARSSSKKPAAAAPEAPEAPEAAADPISDISPEVGAFLRAAGSKAA